MKEKNEENLLNEQINKIKYRMGYQINETPKYKPIIEDDSEFDELPQEIYSTQDGFPMPNAAGTDAYLEEDKEEDLPDEDMPAEPTNAEAPQQDDIPDAENQPTPGDDTLGDNVDDQPIDQPTSGDETEVQTDTEIETPIEEPMNEPPAEPSKEVEVDKLQNEIIKHNIEAMKNLQSKLEDLENINNSLNNQLSVLNQKVEEVEEPTNAEKLMSQKEVSYPFYFNLNDFWQNNWFDQQRNGMKEKGIKELPDGTFIADFDDLNTHNDMDIEDSFNSII